MSTRLNREAYQKLIDEDIKWLKAQVPADKKFKDGTPHILEARHILDVLNWSVGCLYGDIIDALDSPPKGGG